MKAKGLWLVAVLLAGAVEARSRTYALVIGNNAAPQTTGDALPTLRYADDDAARYFQFFARFADHARVLTVLDAESQRRYPDVAARARAPNAAELSAAVEELA